MTTYWINGQYSEEPRLNAVSQGAMLGYGAFETLLSLDARVIWVEEHLARLKGSLRVLGLPDWGDVTEIEEVIRKLLELNACQSGRARIRLTAWGGVANLGESAKALDVMISAIPGKAVPETMRATLSPIRRNEGGALVKVKALSYADNMIALKEAKEKGFDEAILLNNKELVAEGATSNLFWVEKGELYTPPLSSGCLPGVTREKVMKLQATKEEDLSLGRLSEADEVFITNSILGVVPLSENPITQKSSQSDWASGLRSRLFV